MRVALLTTWHERCGIAAYSESLVPALRSAGADVHVLSPFRARGDPGRGDQPRRLWNRNRAFGLEALRVHAALRSLRPDVVHAQVNLSLFSSRFLFLLGELCRRSGLPLVATLHGRRGGWWGRNFKIARLLYALRHADLVVHNESHRAELSTDGARVHVLPHGVDPPVGRSIADARRAVGLPVPGRVIAHFGFLVPDKGVLEVLEAVARVRSGDFPDLFYWISGATNGTSASRAYMRRIARRAGDLGVRDHVHLTGEFVPEERAILELSAADWVVLAYRTGSSQGASGAVRRALASGRPVAVSSAPVFDDVREATFTLHDPLDESIARILRDDSLAAEVAARGRRFCQENSWANVAARHVSVYEEIVSRPAPGRGGR